MGYNCVILDFDDTLVDFKASEEECLKKLYEKYAIETTQENLDIYKKANRQLWAEFEAGKIKKNIIEKHRFRDLLKAFSIPNVTSDQLNKEYLGFLKNSAILYDGVEEFLVDIEEHATLCIITNGIDYVQKSRIKISGLSEFFDGFFTSEKMGVSKPDKRAFLTPLKTLGIENLKNVLVVGDNLNSDIKGAINSGLDSCWFNSQNIENTTKITPKFIARDFTELKSIILGEEVSK